MRGPRMGSLPAAAGAVAASLALSVMPAFGQAAECAPAVRDELLREQSVVQWAVYCPTFLPEELELERVDGGSSPGGGLFTVVLGSASGAEVVVTQGAGASIFARYTPAGPPETPAGDAPFGDLLGKLYAAEPPAVIAFDADGFGHAVQGRAVELAVLKEVAESMRPVADRRPEPRVAPAAGTGHSERIRAPVVAPGGLLVFGGVLLVLAGLLGRRLLRSSGSARRP